MKKMMNRLMLSCKKASEAIVRREDFPLTRIERTKLYFHLLVCGACHAFSKQNELISNLLKGDTDPSAYPAAEIQVPEGLKEQVLSKIAQ